MCKYCGELKEGEELLVDAQRNFFHQSCEDEFEESFAVWDRMMHPDTPED